MGFKDVGKVLLNPTTVGAAHDGIQRHEMIAMLLIIMPQAQPTE
jgi:hypothetical protein